MSEFFEVKGRFEHERPEGMAGSGYSMALARVLVGLPPELRADVAEVLLEYAMDSEHRYNQAAAYLCADLCMRELAPAFAPHGPRVSEWFDVGNGEGWWLTDESYNSAPQAAKNAGYLLSVLWFCNEGVASEVTDKVLANSASKDFRASVMKARFLPSLLKSVLDKGQ